MQHNHARFPFELATLPWDGDGLAPFLSRETLDYHYGKHHRGYVNKLNELVKGTPFEAMTLAEIVKKADGPVFNNAAQIWNHDFYWMSLSPRGTRPHGALAEAIERTFGSFDEFAARFKASATTHFGSGWTWLVKNDLGTLAICNTGNADNPLRANQTPLLVCDVWEHAYYIDYRNERAKYLEAFWKLANWEFAAHNFAQG
jgi:Fe-Mn family superoxide dismutase